MDFNPDQFSQPAFRGFGDQAMRRYRATPQPQQSATAAPPAASTGHQGSLFQAAEVRGAPPQPTFNSDQFRMARHALPGMSSRSVEGQRVASQPQPQPAPGPQPSASGWHQPQITFLGPTPASPNAAGAAGPHPTHWPTPTPAPAASSTPAPRTVQINATAYRNAGPSRTAPQAAPASQPASQPAPVPPRPTTPPDAGPSAARPGTGGRVMPLAGMAVGLGARALSSINRLATDPKHSGNPLYRTNQGWMRS